MHLGLRQGVLVKPNAVNATSVELVKALRNLKRPELRIPDQTSQGVADGECHSKIKSGVNCRTWPQYNRRQMDIGLHPSAWREVYSILAPVSAALLGLFFVAISFHLHDVERNPTLRNRARINFIGLALVLTLSIAVLIPGQSNALLGAEFIVVMIGYFGLLTIGVWRVQRTGGGLRRQIWIRVIGQSVVALLAVVTGISLILGRGPGLFFMVPALLLVVPIVSFNAWNVVFAPELEKPDRPHRR